MLVLRKCGPASAGLADTLLLAGHTSTFFTSTKFEPVKAVLEKSKGKGEPSDVLCLGCSADIGLNETF